ncbi:hypothetical protein AN958_09384 [Leucoagaricus sp. SymC.cos]|nr:hypothetical protein AN958_09384 [Leucoagaricus sp. SymC.cos]
MDSFCTSKARVFVTPCASPDMMKYQRLVLACLLALGIAVVYRAYTLAVQNFSERMAERYDSQLTKKIGEALPSPDRGGWRAQFDMKRVERYI